MRTSSGTKGSTRVICSEVGKYIIHVFFKVVGVVVAVVDVVLAAGVVVGVVGVSAADGVGSVGVVAVDVVGIVFVDLCSEGNAKIRLCFSDKVVFLVVAGSLCSLQQKYVCDEAMTSRRHPQQAAERRRATHIAFVPFVFECH